MLVEHPKEHLELRHHTGLEVEDRLCDEREAVGVDRDADALGPVDAALHARLDVLAGDVPHDLVSPRFLGVVHREIGVDEHVLAGQPLLALEHRDPDARGDRAVARAREW